MQESGLQVLRAAAATDATHNSSERCLPPNCYPETRIVVLKHIMTWARDIHRRSNVLWLFGPARAGKSAIARTITEDFQKADCLAASFFLRTAAGRNNEKALVFTIASELAITFPGA